MKIVQIPVGDMQNFSYIIFDEKKTLVPSLILHGILKKSLTSWTETRFLQNI